MKYPLVVVNSPGLAQAKEEFRLFRKQIHAAAVVAPLQQGPSDGAPLLFCGQKPGHRARLHFRSLTADAVIDGAAAIEPIRLTDKRSAPSPSGLVIMRRLEIAEAYPGCPHCGGRGFVLCTDCGTLSCWDGNRGRSHVCPACRSIRPLGDEGIDLSFEEARRHSFKMPPERRVAVAAPKHLLLTYEPGKQSRS